MITKGGSALMLVGDLQALEDGSYGSYLSLYLLLVLSLLLSILNKK